MNLIFLSDVILTVLALICLIVASYTDFKKREVANWISFSLLIAALVIRTMVSIFLASNFLQVILSFILFILFVLGIFFYLKNEVPWLEFVIAIIFIGVWFFSGFLNLNIYLVSCFLAFGILVILTNFMYYGKMSGGADVKILLALAVVFSTTPVFLKHAYDLFVPVFGFSVPNIFLFDFFVDSLFVGLAFGVLFSIFMAFRNKKVFCKKFKEFSKKYLVFEIILIVLGIVLLILSIFQRFLIIFGIFLIIIPFLLVFISSVQEASMKKYKSWKELTEGDWLVEDVRVNKKIIKPSADGLTKKDILLIKKSGKKVLVLDGMPFVPVFLISLIVSLIFGNLLFLLLKILT